VWPVTNAARVHRAGGPAVVGGTCEARLMGTLTCRDVVGLLADFLERTLSAETLEAFERHLDDCLPCVAYVNTYRKTQALTAEVSRVEMPEEMKARLRVFFLEQLGRG
jgi:hypothetical protein